MTMKNSRINLYSICLILIILQHSLARAVVVINEVEPNIQQHPQQHDFTEFVELYNTENGTQSLSNYTIVFYSQTSNATAYYVKELDNYSIGPHGYFVIGTSHLNPNINFAKVKDNIQNGLVAIALYYNLSMPIRKDDIVTNLSLVDAVVYHKYNETYEKRDVIDTLIPGQDFIYEDSNFSSGEESIRRCGLIPLKQNQFVLGPPTPGSANNCSVVSKATPTAMPTTTPKAIANIVINEINIENNRSYIELYDGGRGNTSLDGAFLVLFDGNTSAAYWYWNLTGHKTDRNGYFVVGRFNTSQYESPQIVLKPQFGLNAVALYYPQSITVNSTMMLTTQDLLDALVYGQNSNISSALYSLLLPNQKVPLEDQMKINADHSVGRCFGLKKRFTAGYRQMPLTPGRENDCSGSLPNIVINEVYTDENMQFLELYDGGSGFDHLNDITLVVFDGEMGKVVYSKKLNASISTDYFVIKSDSKMSRLFTEGHSYAIGLYLSPQMRWQVGTSIMSSKNLIDSIVYGWNTDTIASKQVTDVLGNPQINATTIPNFNVSVGRCQGEMTQSHNMMHRNMSSYMWGLASPGEPNRICKDRELLLQQSKLRINEVDVNQPGHDYEEFIELYDGGQGHVPLDGITLVLYDGATPKAIAYALGNATNTEGYYIIGSSNVRNVAIDTLISGPHWIQNGHDAVAIHWGYNTSFSSSMVETSTLIDAVVYKFLSRKVYPEFTKKFGTLQNPVIGSAKANTSISRCYSTDRVDLNAFTLTYLTPKKPNMCPPPAIVINEFDANQIGVEFIEISSKKTHFPLSKVSIILYNGTGDMYRKIDLDGARTDAHGYYVVGTANVEKVDKIVNITGWLEAAGAIALYYGISKQHPASVSSQGGLIVAVTYSVVKGHNVSQSLLQLSSRNKTQLDIMKKSKLLGHESQSVSRCTNDNGETVYNFTQDTPKKPNNCPTSISSTTPVTTSPGAPSTQPSTVSPQLKYSEFFINEVNPDSPGHDISEYLELAGPVNASLDNLTLVFYNANQENKAYYILDLTGYRMDSNGLFLIGSPNVKGVQLELKEHIQNGPDGIALYNKSSSFFSLYTPPKQEDSVYILDSMVYTNSRNSVKPRSLMSLLSLEQQEMILEDDRFNQSHDESISRCFSNLTSFQTAFVVTHMTPGKPNNCVLRKILINEVNADTPGYDKAEYIELYDGGYGYSPLNHLTLVLFNGNDGKAYLCIPFGFNQTDKDGFFLIGGPNVTNAHLTIIAPEGFVQNGPDAIALYQFVSPESMKTPCKDRNMTQEGLVDAVIYGSKQMDSLMNKLLPNQKIILEDKKHLTGDESISRCVFQELTNSAFKLSYLTPGKANNCSISNETVTTLPTPRMSTPSPTLPKVDYDILINEINTDQPGPDLAEFIEIKGPAGKDMSKVILVLYAAHDNKAYNVTRLQNKIKASGLYVVGTKSIKDADFEQKFAGFLYNTNRAVALYDYDRAKALLSQKNPHVTSTGLIDALVYSNHYSFTEQTQTLVKTLMTNGSKTFIEDSSFLKGDETINRCSNQSRTSSAFVLSLKTPGRENHCPKYPHGRKIQLRLKNADCNEWKTNRTLVELAVVQIALYINNRCNKCGFSSGYIKIEKVMCGSVVLDLTITASNKTQLDEVHGYYKNFINYTKTIKIEGKSFEVDQTCFVSCIDGNVRPRKGKKKSGVDAVGIGVGVTCAVLFLIIFAITILVYWRKKRHGALGFELTRFHDDDDDDGHDADDWTGGKPSFENPLYGKLSSSD